VYWSHIGQDSVFASFFGHKRSQSTVQYRVTVRSSVLMPVYNGEKHVRQAIGSVLSQTLTDHELLEVEDESTDGSVELLESYDSRIRIDPTKVIRGRGRAESSGGCGPAGIPCIAGQ
jgi:hypothetical protein